jgi:hypothetical protein
VCFISLERYSFSASFHLYPTYTPETDDDYEYESDYVYMLVGAPAGIMIDSSTGQIYGSPINYGQFISTVNVINQKTNNFVCSASLQFMIYNSNILTDIIDIFPNNEIIHTKNLPLTITCNYVGAPPSQAQSLAYKLSSPSIESNSIMNYVSSDTVKLTYLVDLSNYPGRFPLTLTDEISGFFIMSSPEICFTATAACFNEDTTVLVKKIYKQFLKEEKDIEEEKELDEKEPETDEKEPETDEKEPETDAKQEAEKEKEIETEQEIYIPIKDLKVGDLVKTYKHGYKKITHIGSQTMKNNPDSISDCMYKLTVRISKEKITHDLILLGRHSILVDKLSKRQQTKTLDIHPVDKIDDKELLITMFNEDFDIIEDESEYNYYHLVLEPIHKQEDQRYGIFVNGSTDPENLRQGLIAATTYKKDFVKQFIN